MDKKIERLRYALRLDVLDMVYRAGTGHIGGDFSACDILTALYFGQLRIDPKRPQDPNRDRFVLSKGHSVEILYAVLARRGFFAPDLLETYAQEGSLLIGHPNNKVPGIEMNTGSLGHGLSISVGMALAGKMNAADYRVYTLMGDGELAEGSVWEAAMAAAHYKLDNLTVIIDRNGLQISGATEAVMRQEDLAARFHAFGWNVISCSGHDLDELFGAFKKATSCHGAPSVIIAHTIKGFGVQFMENQAGWHHRIPNAEEYGTARKELEEQAAHVK